jgi:acyl carrier protein
MQNQEIIEGLTDIFRDVLNDENLKLTCESTAADIPHWDSFNHIIIMAATEVRFGIKFKTVELEQLKNVGELIELITRKLALNKH